MILLIMKILKIKEAKCDNGLGHTERKNHHNIHKNKKETRSQMPQIMKREYDSRTKWKPKKTRNWKKKGTMKETKI